MIVFESLCRLAQNQKLGASRTLKQPTKKSKYRGIHIAKDGTVTSVEPLELGTQFCVPESSPGKTTHNRIVNLLCDKEMYCFGVSLKERKHDKNKPHECLEQAAALHEALAREVKRPAFKAIDRFYRRVLDGTQEIDPDWLTTTDEDYVFVYKGEIVEYLPDLYDFVMSYHKGQLISTEERGFCCVTGGKTPLSLIPTKKVRGISDKEATFTSCNKDTYMAYGWGRTTSDRERFLNAPMAPVAMLRIAMAMQWLLSQGNVAQHQAASRVSVFCWTEDAHPSLRLVNPLFQGNTEERERAYRVLKDHPEWLEDTREAYVMGLSSTNTRAAMQWWEATPLGTLVSNLIEYVEAFSLSWETEEGPKECVGLSLYAIFNTLLSEPTTSCVVDTLRSFFTGQPLPWMFVKEHMRVMASGPDASFTSNIINNHLMRNPMPFHQLSEEDSVKFQNLGRLIWIYEYVRKQSTKTTKWFELYHSFMRNPASALREMDRLYTHHYVKLLANTRQHTWLTEIAETIMEVGTAAPSFLTDHEACAVKYGYFEMVKQSRERYNESLQKAAEAAE